MQFRRFANLMSYSVTDILQWHRMSLSWRKCLGHADCAVWEMQSELELEPRYPLFGGWQVTFTIGYGVPLEDFVFKTKDGLRFLNMTISTPFMNLVVEELTVKVRSLSEVYCLCFHRPKRLVPFYFSVGSLTFLLFATKRTQVLPYLMQVVLPEGSVANSTFTPFTVDEHREVCPTHCSL